MPASGIETVLRVQAANVSAFDYEAAHSHIRKKVTSTLWNIITVVCFWSKLAGHTTVSVASLLYEVFSDEVYDSKQC